VVNTKFIIITKLISIQHYYHLLPMKRPKWQLKYTIGEVTLF